jgi:peptidoglycan hydrolase CwlO-like protein
MQTEMSKFSEKLNSFANDYDNNMRTLLTNIKETKKVIREKKEKKQQLEDETAEGENLQ